MMKKWFMILCMTVTSLALLAGCGTEQKDFKIDEFKTQAESYKTASQELMQKLIAMKYDKAEENKIKEQEEYKKLSSTLKYFESIKDTSAPSELQENVKTMKEKAKTMQTYFDSMVKAYVEAKGDQTTFVKALSEIVRKDENKTVVRDFTNAMSKIMTQQA